MRTKPLIGLITLLAACTDASTTTTAAVPLLSDDCWGPEFGRVDVPWFEPGDTVDVWISVGRPQSAVAATGLAQGPLLNAVRQAVNVWNEESGTALRLYVRGFTDLREIKDAVVIVGENENCLAHPATALPHMDGNDPDDWRGATIELRHFMANCQPWPWTTVPYGQDVVAMLIHEIGHAVFNIEHPGDPTCGDFGQQTVMRGDGLRVLGASDQELAQRRVGSRGRHGVFHWTEMSGPTSWFPASQAAGMDGVQPLFRPGSMSVGTPDLWFGWIQDVDGTVQRGGSGRADVTGWGFGTGGFNWHLHTAPDGALGRPVAVAASTATGELLLAYQIAATVNDNDDDIYLTRDGQICWRTSGNGGATWSSPTCSWEGPILTRQARAETYGLTATYDRHSDTFLVGYAVKPTNSASYDMRVLTIPTKTSVVKYVTSSSLGVPSVHAPALACRSDIECVAAFQRDDAWGTLGTVTFRVDSVTGAVTNVGTVAGSTILIFDTPSIVYLPDDDTYRLAYAVDSAAIYTYKRPAGGGAWTGTGDVFNDSKAFVSSPIMTVVPDGNGQHFPHAWFIRYW